MQLIRVLKRIKIRVKKKVNYVPDIPGCPSDFCRILHAIFFLRREILCEPIPPLKVRKIQLVFDCKLPWFYYVISGSAVLSGQTLFKGFTCQWLHHKIVAISCKNVCGFSHFFIFFPWPSKRNRRALCEPSLKLTRIKGFTVLLHNIMMLWCVLVWSYTSKLQPI